MAMSRGITQQVTELALKSVCNGEMDGRPAVWSGRGRPSETWLVHGVNLNRWEYEEYRRFFEFGMKCKGLTNNDLMTDEEFIAMQKAAAPLLTKRMIDMALVSDDLKEIRQVAGDLSNRGFGKVAEKVDMTHSHKDIRAAWKQLEQRQVKQVTATEIIDNEDDAEYKKEEQL